MTAATLAAQLDAHDALVRACLDGALPLLEFAAAYGDFPTTCRAADGEESEPLRMLQRRIAFHAQVAGVLAGASELDGWLAGAILMRLRHLAARDPDFTSGG